MFTVAVFILYVDRYVQLFHFTLFYFFFLASQSFLKVWIYLLKIENFGIKNENRTKPCCMLLIVIDSMCVLYVYVIHIMKIFCVLWRETNQAAKLEVESCRCHSICVRKRNEIEKSKNLFYVVKSRPYIFLLLLLFRRSYWQYFFYSFLSMFFFTFFLFNFFFSCCWFV